MAKATEAIFLRVSQEDARLLRKAAKFRRMPLATYVRQVAVIAAQLANESYDAIRATREPAPAK